MYRMQNVHYYNTRNAGELMVYKDDCGNWVASGTSSGVLPTWDIRCEKP